MMDGLEHACQDLEMSVMIAYIIGAAIAYAVNHTLLAHLRKKSGKGRQT